MTVNVISKLYYKYIYVCVCVCVCSNLAVVVVVFFAFPDTTPPSFSNTCPKNMVVNTPECSSSALVEWNEPIADDNSGHVIVTYPSIRPSAQLSIGLYYIMYSASDAEGNRANCTFVVQVASKSSKYKWICLQKKLLAFHRVWQLFVYHLLSLQ